VRAYQVGGVVTEGRARRCQHAACGGQACSGQQRPLATSSNRQQRQHAPTCDPFSMMHTDRSLPPSWHSCWWRWRGTADTRTQTRLTTAAGRACSTPAQQASSATQVHLLEPYGSTEPRRASTNDEQIKLHLLALLLLLVGRRCCCRSANAAAVRGPLPAAGGQACRSCVQRLQLPPEGEGCQGRRGLEQHLSVATGQPDLSAARSREKNCCYEPCFTSKLLLAQPAISIARRAWHWRLTLVGGARRL
jgi:hypothetical protein